jgi:hypothetical protein
LAAVSAVVLVTAAAALARSPARSAATPAGEIRVHTRAGASYAHPRGEGLALKRLLNCMPTEPGEHGRAIAAARGGRALARNAVGDQVEVPPGGGRAAQVSITRRPGLPFRSVEVTADGEVTRAILTIDLSGCEAADGTSVVLWGGGDNWTDMGGTVSGGAITVELPHFSIYAVAGN